MVSLDVYNLQDITKNTPELWYELLEAGKVQRGHLVLPRETFDALMLKHYGPSSAGNVMHGMLKPVAKLLGLEDCGGCAQRQIMVNEMSRRS